VVARSITAGKNPADPSEVTEWVPDSLASLDFRNDGLVDGSVTMSLRHRERLPEMNL
jgi:hypothetical protein